MTAEIAAKLIMWAVGLSTTIVGLVVSAIIVNGIFHRRNFATAVAVIQTKMGTIEGAQDTMTKDVSGMGQKITGAQTTMASQISDFTCRIEKKVEVIGVSLNSKIGWQKHDLATTRIHEKIEKSNGEVHVRIDKAITEINNVGKAVARLEGTIQKNGGFKNASNS